MAIENFSSYTEVDPNSKITVAASKVTWALLNRDEDAYVYADKGADYFSGNFEIQLTYRSTGYAGTTGTLRENIWSLTNLIDDAVGIDTANGDFLAVYAGISLVGLPDLAILELDGGTQYSSSGYTGVTNTDYYLTIKRDESVGTYGTLYCYIYSDSARTTLLTTLSVALHTSKKGFRYIFAVQSWDTNEAVITHSGYTENLEIVSVTGTAAPSVTTQATTSVDKTTATGNGNVTSTGSPSATQHGHCWATHPLPGYVYNDGKTEKGVPATTGAFTSALTGLIPNTLYYCRAYIISSLGVFYGAEVQFTTSADVPVVTTDLVTKIATFTALGNGSIDNDGGSAVTQHGHCWALSANPTTADSKTTKGVGAVGAFTSDISGLTANTLYHTRAYATNTTGTGYGADKTFTTMAVGVPIVTTEALTAVKQPTATGHGTIVDIGMASVTQHGHCWAISANPTTADSKTTNGTGTVGTFTSAITGLTIGTVYYIRAYATNTQGTGYGDNVQVFGSMTPGNIAVKSTWFAYIGDDGIEYYLQGIPVS